MKYIFQISPPVFEVSTRNTVDQIPTSGSSPSTAIPYVVHTGTAVPESPEPKKNLQAQSSQHIVNKIATPTPDTITEPPASYTALPSVSYRGRQRKVSSRTRESMEAGKFQSSMLNAFQSISETQHDLDLELQYMMSHPMTFLSEIQEDTMYFHQAISQQDGGDFVKAGVK